MLLMQDVYLGQVHDDEIQTGVSVIVFPKGAKAGVDVRGAAPGTRETDLLKPENMIQHINAVALCGGSAFGLNAAHGVMLELRRKNIGYMTGAGRVPIVPAAVIYDLEQGKFGYPDVIMGEKAVSEAFDLNPTSSVGAGRGATVSKALGMKSAVKSSSSIHKITLGNIIVIAYMVVNALGDVYENGKQLTGPMLDGKMMNSYEIIKKTNVEGFKNTSIGCVVTNAKLDKSACTKVAQMAHDGLARAINPIHTMHDGDTIFACATGEFEADISLIGTLSAEATEKAVIKIFKK